MAKLSRSDMRPESQGRLLGHIPSPMSRGHDKKVEAAKIQRIQTGSGFCYWALKKLNIIDIIAR